jgi:hypothetical protein
MTQFYNTREEEAAVMRAAIAQGVVDRVLVPFDTIDQKVFRAAIAAYRPQKFWNKDPQFVAQTQRYHESVYPPHVVDPTEYTVVELARFPVARGSVGYLKSLEQFVQDSGSGFYPTSSELWGLPFQSDADLSECRWYLRLDAFDGILPNRLIVADAAAFVLETVLPGQPYWELAEFRDIWYPPHCSSKMPNMLVPGGYVLRYFFFSPPTTTWTWEAAGRLRGVTQSALCAEADYNTRISSW